MFHTILCFKVSNSVHTVNCTKKYRKNITCHNLHNYTPSCFTHHHTLINTHMIQPTNNVFVPAYHLCQKISYEKNLSQYTQLQSCTLHTPLYTFTYGNIYAPYWVNSKIYFIKSDHFLPWANQKQVYSNINSKFLWPYTCWT